MNLRNRMITSNSRHIGRRNRMSVGQLMRIALVGWGTSVVPLDSAVNVAFPDITASFGLPIQMIQWVVICYVLTHASLLLAFGRVGDIFGHARVFRAGLLWNGAAFLCCAAAPSFSWLLFCRFLQGIGAALILSCAPALVTSLFPEDRRSTALAVFTTMHALGSAGGPLLGGVLVDLWGWPAVFWFRAPIALTALAFLEGLPPAPRRGAREPVDVFGAVLLALAISTALLSLNQLQQPERQIFLLIVLLGIAVSAALGFILRERGSPHRITAAAGGRCASRFLCRLDRSIPGGGMADRTPSGRLDRGIRRRPFRRRLVSGRRLGGRRVLGCDGRAADAARVRRRTLPSSLYERGDGDPTSATSRRRRQSDDAYPHPWGGDRGSAADARFPRSGSFSAGQRGRPRKRVYLCLRRHLPSRRRDRRARGACDGAISGAPSPSLTTTVGLRMAPDLSPSRLFESEANL